MKKIILILSVAASSAFAASPSFGPGGQWTSGTFSAATLTGTTSAVTLNVSGTTTFTGTTITAVNATGTSAGTVMTQSLVDARVAYSVPFMQTSDNAAVINGAGKTLGPLNVNAYSNAHSTLIPSGFTKFRVTVYFGWTTVPVADSFPVYLRFDNSATLGTATSETLHGTRYGTSNYPDDATGLPGTLTNLGTVSSGKIYRFTTDYITIPSAWQTNAATNRVYTLVGVTVGNNSGGSLTDGVTINHPFLAIVEFQK